MRFFIIIFFFIAIFFIPLSQGRALNVEDLKNQIQERETAIAELEKEIKQYQEQIEEKGKQANTLKNEVARLDATIKKLQADIRLNQRRIEISQLTIEKLTSEILSKENAIQSDQLFLGELIREMDRSSQSSTIEILLAHPTLAAFFDDIHHIHSIQGVLQIKLDELRGAKNDFENEKKEREAEKQKFSLLVRELTDRNAIEKAARDDRSYLLAITKQQEQAYKKLLDERLKKKEALEKEIEDIEQKLRIAIDPASLPQSGAGILGWPLQDISLASCWQKETGAKNCVTQFFGNTDFATQNPQIYRGKGHNGIDFRASIGEPVIASREGTVRAVGDTDKECRGVSYGKWVLIDHPNNLSTLYAHLSNIAVGTGQVVSRGERIGYAGNTGYSTGPHLHFTVFASKAVQLTSKNYGAEYYYKSKVCDTPLFIPISPQNGYLNPLSYL